ncbi:sugar ABC transporter permease [Frondihabitans sucicola]|uniref:Sugar ABC transporter permease n=1 Tax=Frondihabitans sucicola TaxID=1268041 RepID=A0ABM8GU83_9MICO|nr:carbohydrate ABC transporter permease [Frondihabitans sucicola]BDZ51894.1 sugar ABC transporter permease [Frondihabitans sucicola]
MTLTSPTLPETQDPAALVATETPVALGGRRPRRRSKPEEQQDRGIVSVADWRRARIRRPLRVLHGLLLAGLVVLGLGPMLWLAKSAVTPTQDTLRTPLALFPHGIDWANLATAWSTVHIDLYFGNTVIIAAGSWFVQLLVATTGGYALSVLRPKYAWVVEALVLSTLFVPAIVLLVPLYLTVLNPPLLHTSLINTFWAVWLPAGANAFNILLVKRFFDSLPREVFEAARTDGAGTFRLFWSIVLPMSKPILGVVSVFAIIASWKDFLWPLLVLPNPALQPLSVRLPSIQSTTELDVFLAALAISTLIPVVLFLVFQRVFLRSAGLGGAVKG